MKKMSKTDTRGKAVYLCCDNVMKSRERVIRAAKRWNKTWHSQDFSQGEGTKLSKAVDSLLKAEKKV